MLYQLKTEGKYVKIPKTTLAYIGWKEKDLEDMLYKNIGDFISERSLMPIFKERPYKEEPDIMALDKQGNLFIFELKRWVSSPENLLQVLRYGQLFGNSSYEDLNVLYKKYTCNEKMNLKEKHAEYFNLDTKIEEADFNREQNFVVVTNGMDQNTLEAIEYWKKQGIKIDGLIYWVYNLNGTHFIEIDRYLPDKNLLDYETNNYVLNTNYRNDEKSHEEMMCREIAAAYVSGWKEKIDKLQENDKVFLYKSGCGIVAMGEVDGKRQVEPWGNIQDDKYFVKLKNFVNIEKNPIVAAEMKELKGGNFPFRTTMYSIDDDTCEKLEAEINKRKI